MLKPFTDYCHDTGQTPRPQEHRPMSNTTRANAAFAALQKHHAEKGGSSGDDERDLIDLLTDLRHMCDANDLDFDHCMRISEHHHEEEQENEA